MQPKWNGMQYGISVEDEEEAEVKPTSHHSHLPVLEEAEAHREIFLEEDTEEQTRSPRHHQCISPPLAEETEVKTRGQTI